MSNLSRTDSWSNPDGELHAMGRLLDPMRFPYFHRVLTETLLHSPEELSVLDVGCGGGSMSLLFARAGFRVTGVDADAAAIDSARTRAIQENVEVQFDTAFAESLPYGASTFDVVVCSEVLEHVANLERALDEVYRVLGFGGVLLFSTPNRTILSRILLVKVAQDWKPTRVMSEVEHRYDRLIRPDELVAQLSARGIDTYVIEGVGIPLGSIPVVLRTYFDFKLGRVTLSDLARSMNLKIGRNRSLAYIGWGVKYS
ncbi:MAG: bifunctional 2-polyprenyl-6-hydroxyphenol methylase/3-demethylubiquinol 3-O-methyltransferase UbiG [Thermomicrobiales bacterium]